MHFLLNWFDLNSWFRDRTSVCKKTKINFFATIYWRQKREIKFSSFGLIGRFTSKVCGFNLRCLREEHEKKTLPNLLFLRPHEKLNIFYRNSFFKLVLPIFKKFWQSKDSTHGCFFDKWRGGWETSTILLAFRRQKRHRNVFNFNPILNLPFESR